MGQFREFLSEGKTFNPNDVLGHTAYIVTDDKEIFSESGEVKKIPKLYDIWANKGKKWSSFIMDKKSADTLAEELSKKVKEITTKVKEV